MSGLRAPKLPQVVGIYRWNPAHSHERHTSRVSPLGNNGTDKALTVENEHGGGQRISFETIMWHEKFVRCQHLTSSASKTSSGVYEILRQIRVHSVISCRVWPDSNDSAPGNLFLKTAADGDLVSGAKARGIWTGSDQKQRVRRVPEIQFFCVMGLYALE